MFARVPLGPGAVLGLGTMRRETWSRDHLAQQSEW